MASALGASLSMLLEESISPLRAQLEDLNEGLMAMHERMDAMEAAQAGFVAAQRVQTEALDDALPRLDRVERLAAAELPEQLRDLEERLEGLAAAELPEKLRELEERVAEQAEQASSALALEVVGITRQITATSDIARPCTYSWLPEGSPTTFGCDGTTGTTSGGSTSGSTSAKEEVEKKGEDPSTEVQGERRP